jgi:hypothetical protein
MKLKHIITLTALLSATQSYAVSSFWLENISDDSEAVGFTKEELENNPEIAKIFTGGDFEEDPNSEPDPPSEAANPDGSLPGEEEEIVPVPTEPEITTSEPTITAAEPENVTNTVEIHPTLGVHNLFRNNMSRTLQFIKPIKTENSLQTYYVQGYKDTQTSRLVSVQSELPVRVSISADSSFVNIKNSETIQATGTSCAISWSNIGFAYSYLKGDLNQYDLESNFYSFFASINDQNNIVLSYGKQKLDNYSGESFGALYDLNYNNFIFNLGYYQTKFNQETLETCTISAGYEYSDFMFDSVPYSIKALISQDFGDHKDKYGAKQGSTSIELSGVVNKQLTDNLNLYVSALGTARVDQVSYTASIGLDFSF